MHFVPQRGASATRRSLEGVLSVSRILGLRITVVLIDTRSPRTWVGTFGMIISGILRKGKKGSATGARSNCNTRCTCRTMQRWSTECPYVGREGRSIRGELSRLTFSFSFLLPFLGRCVYLHTWRLDIGAPIESGWSHFPMEVLPRSIVHYNHAVTRHVRRNHPQHLRCMNSSEPY